ncbi:hypothetical protein AAL_04257 [Moelleriella libera RCEF 2490]|uniref:Infection structure specific protein n=1 Tax=Moelleriella libera RCEF 2490 TaxID=1081109 RepID=A0A168BZV0_9HYPO|nr:hypothetical protein AAL_04257 [Moelleriella libera RCEF 2490]
MRFTLVLMAGSAMAANLAHLLPRQTGAMPPECIRKASSLQASMPTPAPGLAQIPDQIDFKAFDECGHAKSLTGTLSADYEKYRSSLISWANVAVDQLATCPGIRDRIAAIHVPTQCQSEYPVFRTATQKGHAARETGVAMVAVAAAGMAIAAL